MSFKKVIISTVAVSMLAVSVLNAVAVNADTVDDTQNAISNNKSETDKLLKEIVSANADNIKLQQQISDNAVKIEKTKTNIEQSSQKIDQLNRQIKAAKAEVAKRTTLLKTQLVALQKQTGDTVSGNIYLDFVLNSKNFSDLVARTFTINKLNQASKDALNDVKEAKSQYTSLMDQQETTQDNLKSDEANLETQQNDLQAMKTKSDNQQAALNQKVNDNKATLVALQTQYTDAAAALKAAQDKAKDESTNTKTEPVNLVSNNASSSTSNNGNTSQSNSGSHANVPGNSYEWGQCTWYAKERAPWAGNNWGNGGQWGSSAAAAGFRVDHTPEAGALIVFLPGQSVGGQWTADSTCGHVGYVESVSGNNVTFSQGGLGFSNPAGPNTATLSNGGSYIYIHR